MGMGTVRRDVRDKMREIKFRGKEIELIKEIGAWRYGSLVESVGTFGILTDDDKENHPVVSIVDRKTIGQYTGLKDKDGIEIYEGDIINTKFNRKSIIRFGEYKQDGSGDEYGPTSCLGFYTELILDGNYYIYDWDKERSIIEDFSCDEPIVIGNIYDNPELLGGEK